MFATEPRYMTCSDGSRLLWRHWPQSDLAHTRGSVLVVHGLGEHSGRYVHVAAWLNQQGFAVYGYDQYGHGGSDGGRGTLSTDNRLLDDLAAVWDQVRSDTPAGQPVVLLGHSMGGAVAAYFTGLRQRPVDGLILSSPALDAGLSGWQKGLGAVLRRVAPNLTLANGLPDAYLSHDAAVLAAYRADPLVHDRISGRLSNFIVRAGAAVLAQAPQWPVPTLLLYAGDDHLVNPAGSRRFLDAAPPDQVSGQVWPQHYHELFNETDIEPIWAACRAWLDQYFP